MFRHFFYRNLIDLGDVAVSKEAQDSCRDEGISEETFSHALLHPACKLPDGDRRVIHEREGIRLLIELLPAGYRVVRNVYRTEVRTMLPEGAGNAAGGFEKGLAAGVRIPTFREHHKT